MFERIKEWQNSLNPDQSFGRSSTPAVDDEEKVSEDEHGKIPLTPQPSLQNVVAGFYNSLPAIVRETVPLGDFLGKGDNQSADGPPEDGKEEDSWQDICFIHTIPGDDQDEGLVILADGTFRRFIECKGINALLYDHADQEDLAKKFGAFANSCDTDIQLIVKSRNLPVDEYLSRYEKQIKTDNAYLKWYAKTTDEWFRRVQDVDFIPQREFYVVVSYQPPDCGGSKPWDGQRSVQKHDEFVEALNRLTKTAVEQLRLSNLRPQVLTRKEVRKLIYSELNPNLAKRQPEPPASHPDLAETSVLAESSLRVADEHLWLDGKFIATQYLASLRMKHGWAG